MNLCTPAEIVKKTARPRPDPRVRAPVAGAEIQDPGTMSENPPIPRKRNGPGRFLSLACLALLLLALHTEAAAAAGTAASPAGNTTPAVTEAPAPSDDGNAGGSVYFTTDPRGATIWVNNRELGTSDFTYYFEETGTFPVRAAKKGYGEYTGQVTVSKGRRVVFEAVLMPAPATPTEESTPVAPVATATTLQRSTLTLPTPWPTSPQGSPANPAVVAGAVALGIGLAAARRR